MGQPLKRWALQMANTCWEEEEQKVGKKNNKNKLY